MAERNRAAGSDSGSVVLLVADGLQPEALAGMLAFLRQPEARANRYLLRVVDLNTAAQVAKCWQAGSDIPVLSNVPIAGEELEGCVMRMPPGASVEDTDDLALAMTDAFLAEGQAAELHLRAAQLGKRRVEREQVLEWIEPASSQLLSLGRLHLPGRRGVVAFLMRQFGRFERLITLGLAFWGLLFHAIVQTLRGRQAHWPSPKETFKQTISALGRGWSSYGSFLTEEMNRFCPDQSATLPDARILAQFIALDGAARVGARFHREIVWVIYILSAFAVCAGLASWTLSQVWSYFELVALGLILAMVLLTHHFGLHKRWMALRVGAEQLRCALLCTPLFIAPRTLLTSDKDIGASDPDRRMLTFDAITIVKRATRDQGLKPLKAGFDAFCGARWVKCFVAQQEKYHRDNARMLEGLEHAVRAINSGIFTIVVLAVLGHLFHLFEHSVHLLFISAAGPAVAAALHGATSRLSIVERKELSEQSATRLHSLGDDLEKLLDDRPPEDQAWLAVRQSARSAELWMSAEADDWFKTMLLEELELPA